MQIKSGEQLKEIETLKSVLSDLENEKIFLSDSLTSRTSQYEFLKRQLEELSSKAAESQELHKQRLEIVALEVEIKQLGEENNLLVNHVEYMREVLQEKESYIEALEDQATSSDGSFMIK